MDKKTIADIRFSFDHELIPHHLEGEDMAEFVNQVIGNGCEFLAYLLNTYMKTAANEMGYDGDDIPEFTADQFEVSAMVAERDENKAFVLVKLPENDDENMCCVRYVFACDRNEFATRYFLVERNMGIHALCEIRDGKSQMHCKVGLDKIEIIRAVDRIVSQNA